MNVLDLAEELGLQPKRLASTQGGEYHSACPDPMCGGRDRFCIWPKQGDYGRYWCRQCSRAGDAIQFCRDFLSLSFQDACQRVGKESRFSLRRSLLRCPSFEPALSERPSRLWQERALEFVSQCHQTLLKNQEALQMLQNRGLTRDTILRFKLGYHSEDLWEARSEWGLSEERREDGKLRQQWLPSGYVIPTFASDGMPCKLKVRRRNWKEGDPLPKYVEISGSQKQYAIYGDHLLPIVLVEAEFDGIILQQEAGAVCCSMASGGAGKHPDREVHRMLCSAPLILFSFDFDEAGKKEYAFWKRTYPQVLAWPAPIGKSPSEAFEQGIDLNGWVLSGLRRLNSKERV